jgi:antitoxin component HigA of HigAB toxin-antitoxin module
MTRPKRPRTDYERIEADPKQRPALRAEELLLAATCALSEEMERQDLTKAALAAKMGRTRGDITQILSGARNLTLRTLAEVADALGCKVTIGIVPQRGATVAARLAAGGRR